jgi:hypothetical protein
VNSFAIRFGTVAISNKELHLHYVSSCSRSPGASQPHGWPWTEAGRSTARLRPWTTADLGGRRRQGRTLVEGHGQRSSAGDLGSGPQRPRGRARRQRLAWAASAVGDLGGRARVAKLSGRPRIRTSAASWPGSAAEVGLGGLNGG